MPDIGLLFFILGSLSFSFLGFEVKTKGPLTYPDVPIAQAMHQVARTSGIVLLDVMTFTSFLAREFVVLAVVALTLFSIYKKFWRDLVMLYLGVVAGGGLWYIFADLYHRPRPAFPDPIDHLTGPGFPSGHSVSAVLLYGLIGYVAWPYIKSKGLRYLMAFGLTLLVLLVGFSRIYVGDHYLTDVLAGYALGLAWGGFVYTLAEISFWKNSLKVNRAMDRQAVRG